MPIPNGGLITETNEQYYAGSQRFISDGTGVITTTFNTDLILANSDPASLNYALNNFKIYTSATGLPGSYTDYLLAFTVTNNVIAFGAAPVAGIYIAVQLKALDGGSFGTENAVGTAVQENYGSYGYTSLNDVITGFIATYVGEHKLIADVKRTDVIFHAKRGLQEFSYDTLKSVKSQELSIPPSLSVTIPQDYVNYVNVSWVDGQGIKHIIYPTTLTTNPYEIPGQDTQGIPIQDNIGENIDTTSITEDRWATNNLEQINAAQSNLTGMLLSDGLGYGGMYGDNYFGQRYGPVSYTHLTLPTNREV